MSDIMVLGISGSLRKGSYNTALIDLSAGLAPEGMEIRRYDVSDIPLYNMDWEEDFPESVTRLKEAIKAADGLLLAVPEHNFSFSGVLKNVIDWASRPPSEGVFDEKPVIMQSASTGWGGGMRAQMHLRQVLGYFPMRQMFFPEVMIGGARDKFDADGNLNDETAVERTRKQLEAFREFIDAGSK